MDRAYDSLAFLRHGMVVDNHGVMPRESHLPTGLCLLVVY